MCCSKARKGRKRFWESAKGGKVRSGRKTCLFLGEKKKKVFEMQVLVGDIPLGSVRIEGKERSEPGAKVQCHGCMAEAQKKYMRREDG